MGEEIYGTLTIRKMVEVRGFFGEHIRKAVVIDKVSCTLEQARGYRADFKGMNGEGFTYTWVALLMDL